MKIALVQLYSYHEEVLAPQINFLLPENEVYIAVPSNILENDYIKPFLSSVKTIDFKNEKNVLKRVRFFYKIFSILHKYLILKNAVKKQGIQLLIFNTVTKDFHIKLIKFFFKNVECIHIIHNAQRYLSKKSLESLLFFKKNLFISFDVFHYYTSNHVVREKQVLFNWFCPNLSEFQSSNKYRDNLLSADKINLVVPGSVDFSRRNYQGLFKSLEKFKDSELPFQIIFLGRISDDKQELIINSGITHIIKTFSEYVPGEFMLHCIKNCDAILFLIDKNIGNNYKLYNKYKATGSSIFCLSFGVPCIVSDDFTLDNALENKAITYPGSAIEQIFNAIADGQLTKEQLQRMKNFPLPKEYDITYQRNHYKNLLGLN